MAWEKSKGIRQFILEQVGKSSQDLVRLTGEKFDISRQAVNRHIHKLINDGLIIAEGSTRQRQYKLKPIAEKEISLHISKNLQEDVIWREQIRPILGDIPKNILDICNYGFTEMINNVIDHSGGSRLGIKLEKTIINIRMIIFDNGVGIFKKIKNELGLDDLRHAILELTKGKLTTDPQHHTGEGIFFSSRMFDEFSICSGGLFFIHNAIGHDWLIGEEEIEEEGTFIRMYINISSNRTAKEVFDKYTSKDDDYGFTRTVVPVFLAKYGDENLISRSQAKRLVARLEKFREVVLDFKGVDSIGQAFADEIFRVYAQRNPHIQIMFANENEDIKKSISRAIRNGKDSLAALKSTVEE
ncbi:MAG: STAS-like domain-containing protein [Thermodesulfobacteriota bacterium]